MCSARMTISDKMDRQPSALKVPWISGERKTSKLEKDGCARYTTTTQSARKNVLFTNRAFHQPTGVCSEASNWI